MPNEDFAYHSYIPSPILDDIQNKIHALLTPGLVGASDLLEPSLGGVGVEFVDFVAGDWVYSNNTFMEEAYNLSIDFAGYAAGAYYLYVDHRLDGAVGSGNTNPTYQAHILAALAVPTGCLVLGTVTWDGSSILSSLVDLRGEKFGVIDLLSILQGTYKAVNLTEGPGSVRSRLMMDLGELFFNAAGLITFYNGGSQLKFDDHDTAGGNSIEMDGAGDYIKLLGNTSYLEFAGDTVELRSVGTGMIIRLGTGTLRLESGEAPSDPALYGVYQNTICRAHGVIDTDNSVGAGSVNVASASWSGNECTVTFGSYGVGSNRTCIPACEESGNTDAYVAKVDSISSTQVVIRTYQLNLSADTITGTACKFHFKVF